MNDLDSYSYFYARQYAYDLLRRLLMEEPSVELLVYLQQEGSFDLFPNPAQQPSVSDAIAQLQCALAGREFSADSADFGDLHWDFTRLFIGPETPPAPPWESVYVSRDKLLFQHNTRQVEQCYSERGFTLTGDELEAADHIGFELDFLFHLSSQLVTLLEGEGPESPAFMDLLQVQHDFLQRHPLAFSAAFTRNVFNHAQSDFYRALSTLLQQFLVQDEQQLSRCLSSASASA